MSAADTGAGSDGVALDPLPDPFRSAVQATLDAFVADQAVKLASISHDLVGLVDAARTAVTGGKRLRACFTYWGWRAAGGDRIDFDEGGSDRKGRPSAPVLAAAAAVELVHASALVHDDVMDDSATRRGRDAAHRAFRLLPADTTSKAAVARFGASGAILLGDLLLCWSDELLSVSGFRPKRLAPARDCFDRLRTELVAGQYLDVLAQTEPTVGAARAMQVVRYKSAKYTVERPLQFGAALAKASPELLSALSAYGVPLGEAFQLRDDLLGVFGDAARTGKPAGDDIRDGKRTLLLARAYDGADGKQRAVLDKSIGNRDLDATGLADTQQVLRETGAVDAVETVISQLTQAALASLSGAPLRDDDAREALLALADRITNRIA